MTLAEIENRWREYAHASRIKRRSYRKSLSDELTAEVWFVACQQSVEAKDAEALAAWLNKADPEKQAIIQFQGEEKARLVRAYLHSARLALEEEPPAPNELDRLADELGTPISFRHLRDFVREFRGETATRSLVLSVLLIDTGKADGVVADLTLELMPDGDGTLYPHLQMLSVEQDADFQDALERAGQGLLQTTDFDVRWRVKTRDEKISPSKFTGNSLGGAFSLGIARFLTQERDTLGRLSPDFLRGVAVTASVTAQGDFGGVGGVLDKLIAAAQRGSVPQIHTVIVADGTDLSRSGLNQEPDNPKCFKDPNADFYVLQAGNIKEAIEQLEQRARPPIFTAPTLPTHPFIGRDDLLEELKGRLFAGGRDAFIALTGLPGIGKTALAVELAHAAEVLKHFRDGVLWAGLGRNADVFYHLGRWAKQLGMSQEELAALDGLETLKDAIRDTIGQRRLLLVADDVWEAKTVLDFDLGGVNCAYLFTTRHLDIALEFAGETTTEVKELSEADALMLLAKFASTVVETESERAKALVQAVDRLPLGIIIMGNYLLIKSRTQPDSIEDALEKLGQASERLKQTKWIDSPSLKGVPASLTAVIQLSDEALDSASRAVLRALSVIPPKPNTFSKDAALAVSAVENDAPLKTLESAGLMQPGGNDRYMFHQTICDYARIDLTDETAYDRMVKFFVRFIEAHRRELDALDAENTNIFESLRLAKERGLSEDLVKGTNGLFYLMDIRGRFTEAESYFTKASETAKTLEDFAGSANALRYASIMAGKRAEYAQAETYLEEGLTDARKVGDKTLLSYILHTLGTAKFSRGDRETAEAYWQESLAWAMEIEEHRIIAPVLINLGLLAGQRGDYTQAETRFQEALKWVSRSEQPELFCDLLMNLGELENSRGDSQMAEARFQEGLEIAKALGHQESISLLLRNLGTIAHDRKEYTKAIDLFSEGLKIASEIQHREQLSLLHQELAHVRIACGEYAAAEVDLREGLNLAQAMAHPWLISNGLNGWAELHLERGEFEVASAAFTEALEKAQAMEIPELAANALFGLARVVAAQGDVDVARQRAGESLALLKQMGHKDALKVKEWGEKHLGLV